jgi:hypothetical protein
MPAAAEAEGRRRRVRGVRPSCDARSRARIGTVGGCFKVEVTGRWTPPRLRTKGADAPLTDCTSNASGKKRRPQLATPDRQGGSFFGTRHPLSAPAETLNTGFHVRLRADETKRARTKLLGRRCATHAFSSLIINMAKPAGGSSAPMWQAALADALRWRM